MTKILYHIFHITEGIMTFESILFSKATKHKKMYDLRTVMLTVAFCLQIFSVFAQLLFAVTHHTLDSFVQCLYINIYLMCDVLLQRVTEQI